MGMNGTFLLLSHDRRPSSPCPYTQDIIAGCKREGLNDTDNQGDAVLDLGMRSKAATLLAGSWLQSRRGTKSSQNFATATETREVGPYTTGWMVEALDVPRNSTETSNAPTTLFCNLKTITYVCTFAGSKTCFDRRQLGKHFDCHNANESQRLSYCFRNCKLGSFAHTYALHVKAPWRRACYKSVNKSVQEPNQNFWKQSGVYCMSHDPRFEF